MRYSVQCAIRDRIFVKGYGFLSFAKTTGKNIGEKLIGNTVTVCQLCVKNFLIMLKNLQQMCLKLLQKEKFKKQQKQLVKTKSSKKFPTK